MKVTTLWCVLSLVILAHAHIVSIKGVGGSFAAEAFQRMGPAFEEHRKRFVDVNFTYVVESGLLQKTAWIKNDPTITFSITESFLSPSEIFSGRSKLFPVLGGAVALAYNLPGISDLVLTRETVVGIYNGSIKRWNDPEISKSNPDRQLPEEDIRPVARADASEITDIFTRSLSVISPEWNHTYGTFWQGLTFVNGSEEPAVWKSSVIRYYGRTDKGVIGLIISYRFSIGYVSYDSVMSARWNHAKIVNKEGRAVTINTDSIKHAMTVFFSKRNVAGVERRIHYSSLVNAYPFIGLSYLGLPRADLASCAEAGELYFFVEWLLRNDEARRIANQFRHSVVTGAVADFVLDQVVSTATCNGSVPLRPIVEANRKRERWLTRRPQLISFYAGLTVGLMLLVGTASYFVRKHVRLKRSLWARDWLVEAADVQVRWDREIGWTKNGPSVSRRSDSGSVASGRASELSDGAFSGRLSLPVAKYGRWKGRAICLRKFPHPDFRIRSKRTKKAIVVIKSGIIHANVLRFHGVCLMDGELYLVSDHAERGSLTDVLRNAGYKLDDDLKCALALDIANGMQFLHDNGIVHGNLISNCCVLDERWNVTITNWEIIRLYKEEGEKIVSRVRSMLSSKIYDGGRHSHLGMWMAPELLRGEVSEPTKKSDVYSFAVILVEIFAREEPYSELAGSMSPEEIVEAIIADDIRPDTSKVTCDGVRSIISSAWRRKPERRPSFGSLVGELKACRTSRKPVIESMMATLELYVNNLEGMIDERSRQLAAVNRSLETLLYQILPPSVARRLSAGRAVEPEHFSSSTIFFSDIVAFTNICAASTPIQVVTLLNDLYTMFDSVIDSHDVYKVETIGDAYMCISGVPIRNGKRHVANIADMALQFMTVAKSFRIQHMPDRKLELRAGIHTGAVVAGVIGIKMPRYCLFGDTVNTASRMESTSLPMHIQVSEVTHAMLEETEQYEFEKRGKIHVKGKGEMVTYFLLGKTKSPSVSVNKWQASQHNPPHTFQSLFRLHPLHNLTAETSEESEEHCRTPNVVI